MQSLQELITQKKLLDEKGFPVDVKNVNPSPSEITKAIENITLDFSQSDAVESDVVAGKTFYSKNTELKTGTLELPDFESATATENTVMAGKTFYAGNTILKTGTAKIPDLSQTTATADDVLEGKEFFNASGEKVTGTYKDLLQLKIDGTKDCQYLFYGYSGDNVDFLKDVDTSEVTNMSRMFYKCTKITTIPPLNTSKVVSMISMFAEAYDLKNIPLIDTVRATDCTDMFNSCSDLEAIPLLNFSAMQNATRMFANTHLTEIRLYTPSLKNSSQMFANCDKTITIEGLDLYNVTSASVMFLNCASLTNLNIKNIKISLQIGSGTSYGHLLTLDSLLNTIQELWTNTGTSTKTLTMGTANTAKLADIYVKLIDITDEMRAEDEYIDNKAPFVQCESTDEGAMLVTEYVTTVKNWKLA